MPDAQMNGAPACIRQAGFSLQKKMSLDVGQPQHCLESLLILEATHILLFLSKKL